MIIEGLILISDTSFWSLLDRKRCIRGVFCLQENLRSSGLWTPKMSQRSYWAIPENIHNPPMDDIGNPVRNAQ